MLGCSYNFDSFLNISGKQYVPPLHCVQEFFLLEQGQQLDTPTKRQKAMNEGRGSAKTPPARACAVYQLKLGAEPNTEKIFVVREAKHPVDFLQSPAS